MAEPMDWFDDTHGIRSVEDLTARYPTPHELVIRKQIDLLDAHARTLVEASPFLVMGTTGPNGTDCSPRGGPPGFVQVADEKTLLLPDWPGNNRLDSLRNILANPAVGLIFLFPGLGDILRVNGDAGLSVHPDLLRRFAADDGKLPRSVIVIAVREVFVHCPRAIVLGDIWNPEKHVAREKLPTLREVFDSHVKISASKPIN
ncbi:pyridoxamine 5'-phosphate oxidase [Skermanella aerolata]|uniref:Pyridoxamine 5'-phosphate oxidase n=1 Tax=Skermanella aerolata TaxID=393310 RepID=A0A512DM22_9PROT|nr:MSMEG_1061 family FMN-dependent PPOX-type flavoprotein [Skermanella aerolata]GEO37210.1 pyridoxamine 5'-phosphate oxidase [Skermanella aerolata]